MEKVLVIGGSGFIGQNVVNTLKNNGCYVGNYSIHENVDADINFTGDVFYDENFETIVSKFDKIVYLITTVSPTRSMDNPTEPYTYDIPMLIKTLEAAKKSGIKRVVFASSGGTIYGDNGPIKSKETDFNEPRNHYAICKLTSEKILEMYNKVYGMENISLRISNPYGQGQRVESKVGAITIFADNIINNRSINLYGNGLITRDYIYIEEVANAFYNALMADVSNYEFPLVFNIGSGQGLSLNDIIGIISSELNKTVDINYYDKREFDVMYNVLDVEKAEKYLNFKHVDNEEEYIRKYVRSLNESRTRR